MHSLHFSHDCFFAVSAFITFASASLSLNNEDSLVWGFGPPGLSANISQDCLDAFSASIDCDTFLYQMVLRREEQIPTSQNFDQVCTDTCSNSLSTYVHNVTSHCIGSSDAALLPNYDPEPVAIIGQYVQFIMDFSCQKDGHRDYCGIAGGTTDPTDNAFCESPCAMNYYQAAHDDAPGPDVTLVADPIFALEKQTSTAIFASGYSSLQKCKAAASATPTSSPVGSLKTMASPVKSTPGVSSSFFSTSGGSATTITMAPAGLASSSTSSSKTSTSTNGAVGRQIARPDNLFQGSILISIVYFVRMM